MRYSRSIFALAAAAAAFGQTTLLIPTSATSDSPYQLHYFSNLSVGDSVINMTNSGVNGANINAGTFATIVGSICANVYVFDAAEEMVSCCSCPVTPNGLISLSAQRDLIANRATVAVPLSIVVKLLATMPVGGTCSRSAAGVAATPSSRGASPAVQLAYGLAAWGTTLHANSSAAAGTYQLTETLFKPSALSTDELNKLGTLCSQIFSGNGTGICNSCRLGGL